MPDLTSLHDLEATLRDVTDATAPFVVFYFSGCADPLGMRREHDLQQPRVTLSLCDRSDATSVTLLDDRIKADQLHQDDLMGLLQLCVAKARSQTSAGVSDAIGKD